MYTPVKKKKKEIKSKAAAHAVAQKKGSVKKEAGLEDEQMQPAAVKKNTQRGESNKDNRSASVIQKRLKKIIQLARGRGSHNKKQMIKIKSYITQNAMGVQTTHTVNDDYDQGFIKGHGGYSDFGALATAIVNQEYALGGETLVSVDYKTFSKR
ncbi:MAG: hypothetical protein GY950_34795 [bacterium]|nr:hypothetical protein [bacterium]